MTPPAVACIEALGVASVEPLEAGRQLRDRGLDHQVVVVRHEADGMHAPVVLPDHDAEEPEEEAAVVVVAVDRNPSRAARRHVEEAVGEDVSRQPCHRSQRTP
jgi:hypothetical protein